MTKQTTNFEAAKATGVAHRQVQQILADALREVLADQAAAANGDPAVEDEWALVEALELHIKRASDAARDAEIVAGQIAFKASGISL